MTLGNKIQEIRIAHGMSQEQFGEILNITRQTVSKWELDQVVPDLKKIIAISRLFCISADDLLLNVTNFQNVGVRFACGLYRNDTCEIVETERIAICYYCQGKNVMGAELYAGHGDVKRLISVCEKDFEKNSITWAYAELDNEHVIIARHANDEMSKEQLGKLFDRAKLDTMQLKKSFLVNHGEYPLHVVHDIGIRRCLLEWRNGTKFEQFEDGLQVSMCIGNQEYVYSVQETNTNIYCGCSYNVPFELGLRSYGQYFRLRNYQNNELPFCSSFYAFDYEMPQEIRSVDCAEFGCQKSGDKAIWFVKRYEDTEIILDGCGSDEYVYRMTDSMYERFVES